MKRTIALLLCFCLIFAAFAGCSSDDSVYVPTGDALVMEGQDPDSVNPTEEVAVQEFSLAYYPERSMNPLKCNDFTNRALFSLIYQGLFAIDGDYNVTPILCRQYQISADNRTYTFYIENATFSDGTPLTINDVLATYEAAQESNYYGGRFTHIDEISISGSAIVFSLDTPMENLPLLLDIPILKASEVDAEKPLGTGPYSLEGNMSGAHLRRVLNWWSNASIPVTADSVPLVEAESPSQIRDEFEFDDLGLVCADPCSDAYADYRCDFELWDCDNGIFLFLACNVTYSDYFDDQKLRAALTYAIDREALAEDNYQGFARPATLPADPSSPYYSNSLASKYEYDSMKFIEILSQYLITEPIRLLVNSDDRLRLQTARDIAQKLTELGMVTVTMEKTTNDYINTIYNGDYDLYLGQTRLSSNMDLSAFFGPWANISYNGISDANIYSMCLDALANRGNYYNLHKAVADDGRIIPILFMGYAVYGTRGLLPDLAPSRDNVFYYSLGKTMEGIQLPTVYDE